MWKCWATHKHSQVPGVSLSPLYMEQHSASRVPEQSCWQWHWKTVLRESSVIIRCLVQLLHVHISVSFNEQFLRTSTVYKSLNDFLELWEVKIYYFKVHQLRKRQFPSVINTQLTAPRTLYAQPPTPTQVPIKWEAMWCHTWLTHITGVLNLVLKLWSCAPNVCKYRAFVTESETPNSHRNSAAMESTTTSRTIPLASSRESRWEIQLWKVSYHQVQTVSITTLQVTLLVKSR